MTSKLSVVIPCFNEEKRLDPMAKALEKLCKKFQNLEIIFVNDGSGDQTERILKKFADDFKNVRLLSYDKNQGKGYAVKKGILAAIGEYIITFDADLSIPVEEIDKILEKLRKNDIVFGSKKNPVSIALKSQSFVRRFLGVGFTMLSNVFLGVKVGDVTCGIKGFRNRVASTIFKKQEINGWSYDSETSFLAKKLGIKIVEVPVVWGDVTGSKISIIKAMKSSFADLVKIRLNEIMGKYD